MPAWTSEELDTIAKAEELEIASQRQDGTLRRPVTIWVVRVGDDLYIRSVKGRSGPWYRGTQTRHAGHIRAGGVAKDVTFLEVGAGSHDPIDAAYRHKYRRYLTSIVDSVLTPQAQAATLKLVSR